MIIEKNLLKTQLENSVMTVQVVINLKSARFFYQKINLKYPGISRFSNKSSKFTKVVHNYYNYLVIKSTASWKTAKIS